MPDVTEAEVIDRLRRIQGPDGTGDLVSLGMIGGLVVKGGHVTFAIQVDPKRGPKLESLRQAAEKAVEAIPGDIVGHRRADGRAGRPFRAAQAAARARTRAGAGFRRAAPLVPGVKAIVAVASGKGGVGKSTVASNLALALARIGHSRRALGRRHLRPVPAAHARHPRAPGDGGRQDPGADAAPMA